MNTNAPAREALCHLPAWGCWVGVGDDGWLYFVCDKADGTMGDDDPAATELVCQHYIDAVNAALGTSFCVVDFPMESCEGHG